MRRALSTIAICAMLVGCKVTKHKDEEDPPTKEPAMTTTPSIPATTLTPEQLTELRAAVIANSTLFERPELTPTDPEVVDRFVIEALYEGKYPASPSDRDYYLNQGRTRLTNWLSYDPEGLAYLTKRVEERYAKPVIKREGDLVTIDAGVVPGQISVWKARLQVMKSPLIDRGQLVTPEVVRLLGLGMTQHPDATSYRLEVDIPASGAKPRWIYVYDRGQDVISLYSDNWVNAHYVSGPLGGNLASVTSLYHTSLTQQPGSR